MKTFKCDGCGQRLMFENVFCLNCKHTLGYLPDVADLSAFEPAGDGLWRALSPRAEGRLFRMCANYEQAHVCNWMIPEDEPHQHCLSCRFTRTIPNLNEAGNEQRWIRIEEAKRRLIYTLLSLRLPLVDRHADPEHGLIFDLLADVPGEPRILTGHAEGVITLNVAEAQSDERERMRREMGEKYRTVVGHFRHEIGHYYLDVLIRSTPELEGFRNLFGDERADYAAALKRHHEQGALDNWQDRYISEYASSHPWEDWAETWGNYLHIVDTLESARDAGLMLKQAYSGTGAAKTVPDLRAAESFDEMIDAWLPLTFALNNINRSLGHSDIYPFLLFPPIIAKLRFVHEVIGRAVAAKESAAGAQSTAKPIAAPDFGRILPSDEYASEKKGPAGVTEHSIA